VSSVTAPFLASALPAKDEPVVKVMLESATIVPGSELPVPIVAELPTCQATPQLDALFIRITEEPLAVVNVLPI